MNDAPDPFEALIDAGENVCLTGPGGTGKSYRLRSVIERDPKAYAVTASTGIAALNIGGLTLHRWTGMMLGPQKGESDEDYLAELMRDKRYSVRAGFDRIRSAKRLVIDEISMLNGRILDFLDFLCRRLRYEDRPFGGLQVIVTGDFLQLPPVKKDPNAPYDWAFLSRAWREADFKVIHLTKIWRQEDAAFIGALSRFRFGEVAGADASLLRRRVARFPDANLTRLFPVSFRLVPSRSVSFPKLSEASLGTPPLPETPFHLQASHRNTGTAPANHSCADEYRQCSGEATQPRRTGFACT